MMTYYGSTANFVVNYDSSFTGGPGVPDGAALAQVVIDYCEYDLVRLSMLFGMTLPPDRPSDQGQPRSRRRGRQ